jgi:SAM-dependent methyltransferase
MCERCDARVTVTDGILEFATGNTGLVSEPADSAMQYHELKTLAAGYWPGLLGSVLEVGCGTGSLTRGLIQGNEATDLVITDISLPMLRATRGRLDRAGLLTNLPLIFATHGGTKPVFRDGAFDTCAGTSVLHRMRDVRGFMSNVFRWLRPGGRAFFTEPNVRYHRALGQTLADILALLYREDPGFSHGKQSLLNLVSQWRRGILQRGDLPFLATPEDKYMFAGDTFEAMGREIGFAKTIAIPVASSPTGIGFIGRLCEQLGVEEPVRSTVLGLLPAFADRYLSLLSPRDQTDRFLFWLEKGVGPIARHFRGPTAMEGELPTDIPDSFRAGGLPPRWSFELAASRMHDGIALRVHGWCVVNTDVRCIRVTLGGVGRDTPVWLPRPDVPAAVDPHAAYASWNALCCGVDETLSFPDGSLDLRIEIVLSSGAILAVPAPPNLTLDETLVVTQ